MAAPKTAPWYKLLVMLGDGADPETFAQPCALISKGLNFSAETSDSNVGDCDNPALPTWTERVVRALSGEVSGSGRLALATHATWRTWFLAGGSRNVRIKLDLPSADGGGHYLARMVLTRFNLSGDESEGKIGVEVTLLTDGAVTWVPVT